MGVKWVRWVVGESVLPKCLTLFHVPRVVKNSRKFRKLRKSTSSLLFLPFEPQRYYCSWTLRQAGQLLYFDLIYAKGTCDLARDLWCVEGTSDFLRLSTDLSQSLCMPLRLPIGLPHKYQCHSNQYFPVYPRKQILRILLLALFLIFCKVGCSTLMFVKT